jgi:negative regulator of sigma E activity
MRDAHGSVIVVFPDTGGISCKLEWPRWLVLLAVTAAPTSAAILGVRWVDQPADPIKQVTQSPSVHTVEVWLELLDGESTSGHD